MAAQVPRPGELLCVGDLERKLTELAKEVEIQKDVVRGNFQQLHSLLGMREYSLIQQLDYAVLRAKRELKEKREVLQELETARQGLQRDLKKNKLSEVLEQNLRTLEDKIGEEVAKGVNVGWVEIDWKKEELEQEISGIGKMVILKEKPFETKDYSLKLNPVWFHPGDIDNPMQITIDKITDNIFVVDSSANIVQVFDGVGKHLYKIPTPPSPVGIAILNDSIIVSAKEQIEKINIANRESVGSVRTDNEVWGIDIDNNNNIYGCENNKKSVIVFDENLKFVKRIELKSPQFKTNTKTNSIKLYEDQMHVMFGGYPPFHLQIFTLEGELVRCVVAENEIEWSYFFSIDQLGNIIVADWDRGGNQIKIFSNKGEVIHSINSDVLPGDQKFDFPRGVAVDKSNRIIVAQKNKKCCLQAF